MSEWFVVLWIIGQVFGGGWPGVDEAKLIGPFSEDLCKKVERDLNRWRTPIFAKCIRIEEVSRNNG